MESKEVSVEIIERKGQKKQREGKCLSGSGVIELILIMVVLIAVVILFKGQITALADLIFGDIFNKAGSVF